MKLILPYSSYQHRARQVKSQRLVNCFVESVPPPSKTPITLLRSPGISDWVTLATAPLRGLIVHDELLYAVSGTKLYSITEAGATTEIGSIQGTGLVRMATNGEELIVISNPVGYLYTGGTLSVMSKTNFTDFGAKDVGYIDGFFVYLTPSGQTFFSSEYFQDAGGLYVDAGTIDPLNFDLAIGLPDNLVSLLVDHRQLFLFGKDSIEIWYNAGSAGFPFLREQNGLIEVGCGAANTPVKADNTLFWIDDKRIARRLVDLTPQRISTHSIEQRWQDYTTVSDAYSVSYVHEGHWFWCVTFPTEGESWEFDISTNEWHERGSRVNGVDQHWRVNTQCWCYGENIVGDSLSGKLGKVDANVFTEFGGLQRMEWTYPPVYAEGRRAFHKRLQIEFEAGVGLTSGQGSDPQVMLDVSDDGGKTFVALPTRSIGQIGQYRYRSIWNRLGSSDDRVYRAAISDPVMVAVVDSQLEIEGGRL
jgi:hypothetical protein